MKNNLYYHRRDKGITQSQLAEKLKISLISINRKEQGIREFTLSEAKIVAGELEIDLEKLHELINSY